MHRPEIRKISSTTFAKHFGSEIKFVTEENGHLWLCFRGKPRAVVIPMRSEAVLNEIIGHKFEDILHKANIRAARMVRSAWREKMYRSEIIEDSGREVPYLRLNDEEYRAMKRYWFEKNGPVW